MLTKRVKSGVIKKGQIHKNDTGSASVQVSILSEKIKRLSLHLKKNKQDNHSRRGLLKMVAQRKRLIEYMKKTKDKKLKGLAEKYKLKI